MVDHRLTIYCTLLIIDFHLFFKLLSLMFFHIIYAIFRNPKRLFDASNLRVGYNTHFFYYVQSLFIMTAVITFIYYFSVLCVMEKNCIYSLDAKFYLNPELAGHHPSPRSTASVESFTMDCKLVARHWFYLILYFPMCFLLNNWWKICIAFFASLMSFYVWTPFNTYVNLYRCIVAIYIIVILTLFVVIESIILYIWTFKGPIVVNSFAYLQKYPDAHLIDFESNNILLPIAFFTFVFTMYLITYVLDSHLCCMQHDIASRLNVTVSKNADALIESYIKNYQTYRESRDYEIFSYYYYRISKKIVPFNEPSFDLTADYLHYCEFLSYCKCRRTF
jgi:hypothetical protein